MTNRYPGKCTLYKEELSSGVAAFKSLWKGKKVIQLLEEGEIQSWEEDVPQIRLEELPAEDA